MSLDGILAGILAMFVLAYLVMGLAFFAFLAFLAYILGFQNGLLGIHDIPGICPQVKNLYVYLISPILNTSISTTNKRNIVSKILTGLSILHYQITLEVTSIGTC